MFILFAVALTTLLRHHADAVVLSYGSGLDPGNTISYSAADIGMTYGDCWIISHLSATAYIDCPSPKEPSRGCPGPVNLCAQSGHQTQVQFGVRLLVNKNEVFVGKCASSTNNDDLDALGKTRTRNDPQGRQLRVSGPGCPPFLTPIIPCPMSDFTEYFVVEIGKMNVTSVPSSFTFKNPSFKVCIPHHHGAAEATPVLQLYGTHGCGSQTPNTMQYVWDLHVEINKTSPMFKQCLIDGNVPADDCCDFSLSEISGTYREPQITLVPGDAWSLMEFNRQRNLTKEYQQFKLDYKPSVNRNSNPCSTVSQPSKLGRAQSG